MAQAGGGLTCKSLLWMLGPQSLRSAGPFFVGAGGRPPQAAPCCVHNDPQGRSAWSNSRQARWRARSTPAGRLHRRSLLDGVPVCASRQPPAADDGAAERGVIRWCRFPTASPRPPRWQAAASAGAQTTGTEPHAIMSRWRVPGKAECDGPYLDARLRAPARSGLAVLRSTARRRCASRAMRWS